MAPMPGSLRRPRGTSPRSGHFLRLPLSGALDEIQPEGEYDPRMPIRYAVAPGTLLLCDYSQGGFVPPEMVKRRPAIVVSPRLPHRDGLCAVVPLSTTAPDYALDYVVELTLMPALPSPFDSSRMWAKCDMIATVGFGRLDLFRSGRDQQGRRKYLTRRVDPETLERVLIGVRAGLGI